MVTVQAAMQGIPNSTVEQPLILAAQRGDVAAFNELVRLWQATVYRTAYRLLGDRDLAEDATQEAFVSAYKHLGSYRGGSFKAWLMRIVTNGCYDLLRARQRHPLASLEALSCDGEVALPHPESESPEQVAERHELDVILHLALQRLSPEQRLTVILADIEEFKLEEIAGITRTNIGTVKSRLARGRLALRDLLLPYHSAPPAARSALAG